MGEFFSIAAVILGILVSLGSMVVSLIALSRAKDAKLTDELAVLRDGLAEHERIDAADFSTVKARLHAHRALLRFLQSLPERVRVLEYIAKIKTPTKDIDTTDDGEDDL